MTNVTTCNDPVLDESAIDRLVRIGGRGFVRQILDTFLEYTAPQVDTLRALSGAGPLDPPRRRSALQAAHALKNSAGNIGATRLFELASTLEQTVTTRPVLDDRPRDALIAEFDRVVPHIHDLRRELGDDGCQ